MIALDLDRLLDCRIRGKNETTGFDLTILQEQKKFQIGSYTNFLQKQLGKNYLMKIYSFSSFPSFPVPSSCQNFGFRVNSLLILFRI